MSHWLRTTYRRMGNPAPTVVKVDVETHEPDVLAGAEKTIAECRPVIILEILPKVNRGKAAIMLGKLSALGYSFHHLHSDTPWPVRSIDDVLGAVNSASRDWIITPEPLSEDFFAAFGRWQFAIAKCDASTNRLIAPRNHVPKALHRTYGNVGLFQRFLARLTS